jgi:hypothetical protein
MSADRTLGCPQCGVAFEQRTTQGVTIDYCPDCGGVWLDPGELGELTDDHGHHSHKHDRDIDVDLDDEEEAEEEESGLLGFVTDALGGGEEEEEWDGEAGFEEEEEWGGEEEFGGEEEEF